MSDIVLLNNEIEEYTPKNFTFFVKPTYYDMSELKLEGLRKFSEIIQWGRRNPIKFCERFFGVEFLDYQKYVFMMSWITPNVVWCMSRNAGKALDLNTRIPTPNGDKIMKDIHVGDHVFDENGNPTMVTYESPIYINHDCYKVTFDDGEEIIADGDHNWYVTYNCRTTDENGCIVRTTKEMYKNFIHRYKNEQNKIEYRYKVFRSKPVKYNSKKKLLIHPYILGLWLGDGKSDDGYINVSISDSDETIKNIKSVGYKVYSITKDRDTQYRLRIHSENDIPLKVLLRQLNLISNKHIPDEYLYTSVDNRIQLLQGLMDTDGTIDNYGRCEFSQSEKHKEIINGVDFLLNGLGIKHNVIFTSKKCNNKYHKCYRINFITDSTIPPFKMNRKLEKVRKTISNSRTNKKSIINIELVESRPVKCIQVASNSHLYLCGEKNTITHNTTLGSPFLMAKTMLLPKFEGYILSSNGSQSIGMMKKIEAIAKKEIASFTGLTDVFLNELVKSSNSEGFRHDPASYSYKLYSGSSLATINSNFDGSRGRRSRLNFYDEASYVPEDMYAATLPFVTQNSDFALGGDIDVTLIPPNFPNQVICASSAGSMDDVFYKRYKEAAMHSFAGDKNYFCADIDCEVILKATYNGKIYPVPLLTQEKIDSEMKMNPTKATREYKNKFDSDFGDDIAVKKSQVLRNSEVRPPILVNEDGSLFVIAFDPAKKRDNSFVLIGKLIRDDKRGWIMQIVNGINLIDKETRKPLTTPEQVKELQKIIINYNGYGVPDYKNIHGVYTDAGSGGGATQLLDLLFDNFYENKHKGEKDFEHRGMIDANYDYCIPYVKRYPDAVDIIRMKEPSKYKTIMYTQLCEMIDQDLISFTAEYDYHGVLTMLSENKGEVIENTYKLSLEEEIALKQLDAMKEEVTHMYKYRSSNGNIRYDLAPGFENVLHDDRAYCLALLGHALFDLRSKDTVRQKRPDNEKLMDEIINLPITRGRRISFFDD